MANPRVPTAKAEVTGRTLQNPGRFKNRSKPKVRPLGAPYKRMSDEEQEIWAEYASEFSWLNSSDRKILAIACRLTARFWNDPDMPVAALAQLRMCLSAMGGTPSDLSKIYMPEQEDEDPAAKFLN
ncbi:MAG: hypothetical protein AAF720_00835 [Pseudomonadota bacterium]